MNAEPNLDPLLRRLRALLPDLRRRYGVDTLEVFGSRVRADAREGSDLDLLISAPPRRLGSWSDEAQGRKPLKSFIS